MLLETERLMIRPFAGADEDEAIALFMNPEFMVGSLAAPLSRDGSRAKLQGFIDLQQSHGFSKLALRDKSRQHLLGYCGFDLQPIEGPPEPEFGYRLHPEARGKGIATEAAKAVVADAFGRLKMPFVQAIVAEDNRASRRVLEKLHMTYRRDVVLHDLVWMLYRAEAPP